MDPAQVPSGGIPWLLAAPAFVFLVFTSIAVVKWIALRADTKIAEAEARELAGVAAASAEKERVRAELTKKIDELENEVQDELRKALDLAHARMSGRPPRPPEPPPGIVRKKHSTRELLQQVQEVTGRFRREDLMEDTQGV